jgi:hypothetical protein
LLSIITFHIIIDLILCPLTAPLNQQVTPQTHLNRAGVCK